MLVERHFCSSEFQPPGAGQDTADEAGWGNAPLSQQMFLLFRWQMCAEGRVCVSVAAECVQTGFPWGCNPPLIAVSAIPLEHSSSLSWGRAGRAGQGHCHPRQCHTPCPASCQPWIRHQAPSKITKFNLPFFFTSSFDFQYKLPHLRCH